MLPGTNWAEPQRSPRPQGEPREAGKACVWDPTCPRLLGAPKAQAGGGTVHCKTVHCFYKALQLKLGNESRTQVVGGGRKEDAGQGAGERGRRQ